MHIGARRDIRLHHVAARVRLASVRRGICGFRFAALDKGFRYADSVRSGAVMVVSRNGRRHMGEVARKLELHSVARHASVMPGMAPTAAPSRSI
jgi:hypothetical protein